MRFYVYALSDSRDSSVFYIGKGCGDRKDSHLKAWRKGREPNPLKATRISEIIQSGGSVVATVIRDGLSNDEALALERRLILKAGLNNLTNISPGNFSIAERAELWARRLFKNACENWDLTVLNTKWDMELHSQWGSVIKLARQDWSKFAAEMFVNERQRNSAIFHTESGLQSQADALREISAIYFSNGVELTDGRRLYISPDLLWEARDA